MLRRRLILLMLTPLALVVAGTIGYSAIEGWPPLDALYMTVITLTTVGYAETHPLSGTGRVFTMALALGGIFMMFFAGTEVVRVTLTGELAALLGRRRMDKRIAALRDHIIVCGFGRMGQHVCEEFSRQGVPFVVIERAPERLAAVDLPGAHTLGGDATDDDVLRQAGIDRARALVVVVDSDADNVFITMSARLLADKLPIIARAEEASTVKKLTRAGATRVVSPYTIGGGRVAQAVLKPSVLDFIEVATRKEHLDLQIEEIEVRGGSALAGRTVAASGLRSEVGLILVAIKQPSGHMVFNPTEADAIASGDTLIVMGRRDQLDRAGRLATA